MEKKKWQKSSPELVELFQATMETFPDAQKRKMFGYPCCFVNGHMFTGLHEQNWIVRLSEEDRLKLISAYKAQIFEPMPGRQMKEYIALPKTIIGDTKLRARWINRSLEYATSLPPKVKKLRKKRTNV